MKQQEKTIAVLRLAMDCIIDAAQMAGADGYPSGHIYAALTTQGMTLDTYNQIVSYLINLDKIAVVKDRLYAI